MPVLTTGYLAMGIPQLLNPPHLLTTLPGTCTVNHSASNGFTTNWSNQTNLITVLSIADPNPNSMIKYKTSQSIVNIDNQTPYVGTGVIRNISSNTHRLSQISHGTRRMFP